MFCFQSPFTRASRGIVTTNPPHQTKEPDNDRRRDSETISERSNSASSIRYIDQEMSSSTDTLPGIRTDYLDTEGGLPSSPKTATTSASTANYPQPSPGTREDANPTTKGSTSPPPPPVPPLENDNTTSSSTTTVSWHRKFMLRLRSTDSNSSEEVSSFSSERSKDTPGMESNGCGANLLKIEDLEDDLFEDTRTTGVYASMNDIPSLTNGYSDQEEDEEEEDEDEDVEDDDDDDEVEGKGKVIVGGIGDGDDDGDDGGGGGGGGGVGVGGGHKTNYKGEKAGGCSLPSSPAVPSMNTVPYYGFLSVNGGAMRQESTSTSSPQLSTGSGNFRNVGDGDDGDEGDERSPPSKSKDNGLLSATLKPPDCLPAARSCPNLERQSIGCSPSGSSSPIPGPLQAGPRFKPLEEGDIQVCYLNHTRSLVNKILSSKFLRRWETHHLYLNDACLSSKTLTGFLQQPVPYSSMSEVYTVARWDPTYKYCLIIVLPDGSLLLQASNAYTRDQWYHSILWKKSIFKYQHLLLTNTRADVILRELKTMVDFALWTPLQDERISGVPLEAVAKLLEDPHFIQTDEKISDTMMEESKERDWAEAVLAVAAPLLERVSPPVSLTRALAKLAQEHPKSPLVTALSPAITRCLKHTVDFGKSPDMRKLLQVFVAALYENDDGEQALRDYIASVHGPGSDCPHPRVLPNLVSICVAAVFHRFDVAKRTRNNDCRSMKLPPLNCYLLVLNVASEYADWRPGLGALLQPVPFPEEALADKQVQDTILMCIMQRLAKDPRCSVHRVLLPVREPRPGWIHIAAPSSPACPDQGELFAEMLTALLGCCCRRKRFIGSLMKQTVGACILLGVRGCDAAQEALCLMLEWRLLPNEEARLQVVSALQSSPSGRNRYAALCQRQRNLQELQQKGGPRKLTLPVRATDADVALLLGGGALGNLECLSLAFTSVTSACAEQLIKLPALRYLNLWATQFGDAGLQMISEHLQKLQVLNLCETPVSDKGISTLASLTSLRKLNLNSTKLSAQTFESLKKRLPSLQEFDVRYTEAW